MMRLAVKHLLKKVAVKSLTFQPPFFRMPSGL